jgi:hypothetical protein
MQDRKAPPTRRLLETRWPADRIAGALLPVQQWKPHPTAADRAAWQSLPSDIRSRLVTGGEEALKIAWPVLPATLFLEFVRNGNRSNYERVVRTRRSKLEALLWAECVEGKGRFLDEIANGVWLTCEETFWGYPAHMNLQKDGPGLPNVAEPVIDLFAAEAGALLAWTHYLLGPQLAKVHAQVPRGYGTRSTGAS